MRRLACAFGMAALVVCATAILVAQGRGQEHAPIQIPDSSIEQPGEHGVAAHTNHIIRVEPNAVGTTPRGETPASIASVYSLTGQLAGAGVIVIVDAFHYPTALGDFNHFSQQFGLPLEASSDPLNANNQVFQVIYAHGKPRQLRVGAGSGTRHRVGARDGAEREDRAGRGEDQQFCESVPGRRRGELDRQHARGVDELGRQRVLVGGGQ